MADNGIKQMIPHAPFMGVRFACRKSTAFIAYKPVGVRGEIYAWILVWEKN